MRNLHYSYVLVLASITLLCSLLLFFRKNDGIGAMKLESMIKVLESSKEKRNPLDGCAHVYLGKRSLSHEIQAVTMTEN